MIQIHSFVFNAFQENTYIVNNEESDAIIFDPGCSNKNEQNQLSDYISDHKLKVVRLVNTHCHIDHVLGNKYVSERYNAELEAHKNEEEVLKSGKMVSDMYGIPYELSPSISKLLSPGNSVCLGSEEFRILFCPGHSPGSLCFYHEKSKSLIGGDVLFYGSIGRTDLPGGNHADLIHSIKSELMTLPDDTIVYPGHGSETNIGYERKHNPFLQ